MKTRRVGSITFGVTLIVFGILFLLRFLVPAITYEMVVHFWPIIFIFLGVEILIGLFISRKSEDRIKYDIGAMLMTAVVTCLAAGMAAAEYALEFLK